MYMFIGLPRVWFLSGLLEKLDGQVQNIISSVWGHQAPTEY